MARKTSPKLTESERHALWARQAVEAIERAGYRPSVWFKMPLAARCAILRGCIGVAAYRLAGARIMSSVADRMRPVPEQMQHGEFEVRPVEKDGDKVARRRTTNLLEMLQQRKTITLQQARAGEAFAKDHRVIWGSPGARDSCIQRVGGEVHETEAQAEKIIRAKHRTNRILNRCGPGAYALMVQVAVYDEALGRERTAAERRRYETFRVGLDIAANVYAIPYYEQTG